MLHTPLRGGRLPAFVRPSDFRDLRLLDQDERPSSLRTLGAPRLRLATGGNAGVERLLRAFNVAVRFDGAGALEAHDTCTHILDEKGSPQQAIPLSNRSDEAILAALQLRVR